ncbi:MAG TPA: Holliday junction branch migration protein RuvA [Desulfobacteraceae bacterium]|nr:Holliday junction branch migration protein RuvA [Deltaproteobacteria bacterium]MBW2355691.1 Holliday junction branch migration protein RuvA [Deltaproteobacteria bacterium]RLB95422.1 MAG: Holliday junction DNA helicase RuvA [Deltaproteobacteria bacterium]HDI59171.1 Holliday junction branch migration protein RuvA [Desulfobacteraceae bacterium]
MIGYLEGTLLQRYDDRILLLVGAVGYEVLLPAGVIAQLGGKALGDKLALYIYHQQTERQPRPLLIGFRVEAEKEFFQLLISVSDVGPMKALRAMTLPVRDIARAIENRDVSTLQRLPGIGMRTAHKIIASLEGKMGKFALIRPSEGSEAPSAADVTRPVMEVLVSQLGYKTPEARRMIDEAFQRNPTIDTPEALFEEVYRGEVR